MNLKLVSLTCHLTDEKVDDEVFLVFNKNQVWPVDKKFVPLKSGKVPINLTLPDISSNTPLSFELWDYDRFSTNDNIGSFTMLVNEKGGPFFTDLKKSDESSYAKYTLEWEVY